MGLRPTRFILQDLRPDSKLSYILYLQNRGSDARLPVKMKCDALCEMSFVNANILYKYKLFLVKMKY